MQLANHQLNQQINKWLLICKTIIILPEAWKLAIF